MYISLIRKLNKKEKYKIEIFESGILQTDKEIYNSPFLFIFNL